MKKFVTLAAAVTAVSLTLTGCAADSVNGAAVQAEVTRSTEVGPVQANTFDVQFIERMKPRLQRTVEMGEQLLATDGVDSGVRNLAETSMNRQQDEIIQLNSLLEQWNSIDEATEGVNEALPEATTSEDAGQPVRELAELPAGERQTEYLNRLRGQLSQMIALAEEEARQGESEQLRDQAELMISTKRERIGQVDALLGR